MFSCRLTEFSRNETLWDFPTTKLRFAEFPLTFFPFSFCGGVSSFSPRGFSILPRGVFLFFPAIFRQACDKKNSPNNPGSFRSFYIF